MHATHQIIKGLGQAHRRIQQLTLSQHNYLKEMIKWQASHLIEPAAILQKALQDYLEHDGKNKFNRDFVTILLSKNALETSSDYVLLSIKLLNKHHGNLQADKLLEMFSAFLSLYRCYEVYLNQEVVQKLTLVDIFIENFELEVMRAKRELARSIARNTRKDKDNKKLNACYALKSYISLPIFKRVSLKLKQEIIAHILSLLIANKENELLRKSAVDILSKLRKYIDNSKRPEIIEKILTLFKQHPNAEHWHLLRKFYHYFSPTEQEAVAELISQLLPKMESKDHLIVYDFLSLVKRMLPDQQKILLPSLLNYIDKEVQHDLLAGSFLNLLLLLRNKVGEDGKHILNEYIENKITPFNLLWYEPGLLRRVWFKLKKKEQTIILTEIQSFLTKDPRALIVLSDIFPYLRLKVQMRCFDSIQQIDYSKNSENCLPHQARLKIIATIYHHLEGEEKRGFLEELEGLLAKKTSVHYKQVRNIIKYLNENESKEIYINLRERLETEAAKNNGHFRISVKIRLDLVKKSVTFTNHENKQKIALTLFDLICKPPYSQLTRRLAAITPFIPHLNYAIKIALMMRLMSLPSKQTAHRQLYSLLYNACEVDVKLNLLQRSIFADVQTNLQSLSPEIVSHVRKFMF